MSHLREITTVSAQLGLLSFGGPAAQIAMIHDEMVAKRGWLDGGEFLRGLSFCMLLPGPEAMQLATYAGWKRGGVIGGLIAGGLFVLPGALAIAVLALLYGQFGNLPAVQAVFLGVKAAVIAIVLQAVLRLARRALPTTAARIIAALSFAALFLFDLPFPLVIGIAALTGAVALRPETPTTRPALAAWNRSGTLWLALIGSALWVAPLGAVWLAGSDFLLAIGGFFAKLALLTFGGAYAVLSWMAQEVVGAHGWVTTAELMDSLGLAETTPGPLILVTQFIGMLAGAKVGGWGLALITGALVLWMTFLPSFIFILAGAPLIRAIEGRPRLEGALAGLSAAVVGVILDLSLWFAANVLFDRMSEARLGPLTLPLPQLSSLNPVALTLALLAGYLLLRRAWPLPLVLALCGFAGFGLWATTLL